MSPTTGSFSTSESLIRRVKARDPEAWYRLSQLYGPMVYEWARKFGLQDEDSAEIVQNVFLSISQKVELYSSQGPQSTFRGWLWTITRNSVFKFHRDQSSRPTAVSGIEGELALQQIGERLKQTESGPEIWDAVDPQLVLVHRAVGLIQKDFEPRTWEAFYRTTVEEQSAAEVGESLGLSAKAVRQAKYRILLRLRQMLANE